MIFIDFIISNIVRLISRRRKVTEKDRIDQVRLTTTATLSQLAYKNIDELEDDIPLYFFNGQPYEDAQAYLCRKNRSILLAFRGTSSKEDVLSDIDVRMYNMNSNARVHNGFMKQFKSIAPDIRSKLKEVDPKTYDEVIFCGHSLGGALAILAAVIIGKEIRDIHEKQIVCHTYGAPRVGNHHFARLHEQCVHEHWRVHCEQDPVPMIPASYRFVHPPRGGLCLPDTNSPSICDKDIPWWRRLFAHILSIDWTNPIKDHDCEQYIQRLSGLGQMLS